MADEATYFVVDNSGNTYGPADFATLKEWVADGRVLPDTNLKNVATGVTMQARFVAGLFEKSAGDTKPPVQRPTMTYVSEGEPQPKRKSSVGPIVVLVILGAFGLCGLLGAAILFPVFAQANIAAKKTQTLSNLKQIGVGLVMYTTDFDDRYPLNMSGVPTVAPVLMPYIKNADAFKSANPAGSVFLGNPKLSGKVSAKIVDPPTTVLFYDSKPWPSDVGLKVYSDIHAVARAPFNRLETELQDDPFK